MNLNFPELTAEQKEKENQRLKANLLALQGYGDTEARHTDGQAAMVDPRATQLLALFLQLDERGKTTTLAMLAVAVKLHPKEGA